MLGKIVGVHLGRPFGGGSRNKIMTELGEICHFVHEGCSVPLDVTDDDVSSTFVFLRAVPDRGSHIELTETRTGLTTAILLGRRLHNHMLGRPGRLDRVDRLSATQERGISSPSPLDST
jgi:hypothetical protein